MKYVLSLDGGGIRGVIPAVVLMELETRTGNKISEMFDLISGTSTGGILALGFTKKDSAGKIAYTASDLLNLYLNEGSKIFHRSVAHEIKSLGTICGPKYSHKNIEKVLHEYFGTAKMGDATKPTMVTTYDLEGRQPYFLKSWNSDNQEILIKEAARATSAAPTYFSPALVNLLEKGEPKTRSLIDGGVFINNPAVSAYAEALRKFPGEEITVVSIGTGQLTRPYNHKKTKKWGIVAWIKPLLSCMFDGVSEAADYQMGYFLNSPSETRFFRLQVELEPASDDIDDTSPENMQRLQNEAKQLITQEDAKLKTIAKLLPHTPPTKKT